MTWRASVALAFAFALVAGPSHAHSASDAFLTLRTAGRPGAPAVLEAQWDIALRDLDFVLNLDADGDGRITWAETRARQGDIARFAYDRLRVSANGVPCVVTPGDQKIAGRPDGSYAALFFRVACTRPAARITIDYRLFFDVDPTHRGILLLQDGNAIATALAAPDQPRTTVELAAPKAR